MEIERLGSSDEALGEVVAFITRLNRDATHHVLYCDEDEAALMTTLSGFGIPPQDTFVIARAGGEVKGVLGFDADERLGRAWAYGPFVDHAEHKLIAETLWESSVPLLPETIGEIEMAFDVRNKGLDRFAEDHGMTLYKDMPVLSLRNDDWARVAPGPHKIAELNTEHFDGFEGLHDVSFPSTFWSAREIVERLNDHRRVMVATDDSGVIGYIYAEVDAPTRQGGIEFLAVAPDKRRDGVGNALVEESLRWLFSAPEVDEVFAIVDDDNSGARALFEGFGFRVIRRMRAFRTPRPLDTSR